MAFLYISEYGGARQVEGGLAQIAEEPGIDQTPVSFTTTTQSAAFAATTKMVRVLSDADCHIAFGKSPVATTNSKKVIANSVEYFGVKADDKVAAVTAA